GGRVAVDVVRGPARPRRAGGDLEVHLDVAVIGAGAVPAVDLHVVAEGDGYRSAGRQGAGRDGQAVTEEGVAVSIGSRRGGGRWSRSRGLRGSRRRAGAR